MKVKIKSWERMVEEFGYCGLDVYSINLKVFNWHIALEGEIPDDRIIEVSIKQHIYSGLEKKGYYYRCYGISEDAIEEYLTDESGNDLTNPLHPANSELLPELKSEEIMKSCNNCVNLYDHHNCGMCFYYEDKSKWQPRDFEESFNNLPNPEPQQEFKLKPLAEILEEESKPKATENYNNSIIKHLSKMQHRTHYYKFQLEFDNDYSIRYYLEFESRPECVGNYYLKSHSKNEYSLLPKEMAEDLIRKLCKIEAEEIIGRRLGKKYEKVIVGKDKLVKFT